MNCVRAGTSPARCETKNSSVLRGAHAADGSKTKNFHCQIFHHGTFFLKNWCVEPSRGSVVLTEHDGEKKTKKQNTGGVKQKQIVANADVSAVSLISLLNLAEDLRPLCIP